MPRCGNCAWGDVVLSGIFLGISATLLLGVAGAIVFAIVQRGLKEREEALFWKRMAEREWRPVTTNAQRQAAQGLN